MLYRAIPMILAAAALALGSAATLAAEEAKPATSSTTSPATKPATKPAASAPAKASKDAAGKTTPTVKKPKPVDINNATVDQLTAVPGLDRAHAMKIVSNRPYPTRAWLVTKGILSEAKYAEVKDHLIATPNTSPKAPTSK